MQKFLSFLAVALVLSFATPSLYAADTAITPLQQIKIPLTPLLDLVDLSEDDIIATLRKKHDIKVIILPELKDEKVTLKSETLEEDKEALKFYADKVKGPFINAPTLAAMFLTPYLRVQTFSDAREAWDRPGMEKPIILVRKNTTRYQLMHEFVHFLIWQARGEKAVEMGKVKVDVSTQLKLQEIELTAKVKEMTKAMETEKDETKFRALAEQHAKFAVRSFQVTADLQFKTLGEEMDITRLMCEMAGPLKLTKQDIFEALGYHNFALSGNLKRLRKMGEIIGNASFQKLANTDDASAKVLTALVDTFNKYDEAYCADGKWFDAQAREKK